MLLLGLLTLIALFTSRQGVVASAWLRLLSQIFGWGMILVPLGLLAGGTWTLLRGLGDRLPRLEWERGIGLVLSFLLLLTMMHTLVGGADFEAGLQAARAGQGGGLVGAAILALLVRALGLPGAGVTLAAWLLIALTFTAGISIGEIAELVLRGLRWLRDRFQPAPSEHMARRQAAPPLHAQPQPASRPAQGPPVAASAVSPADAEGLVEMEAPAAETAWELPDASVVLEPGSGGRADETFDRERARLIEETLNSFGAPARVVEINRGPVITQFGVEPDFVEGRGGRRTKVKVSKISALADDLALALAAASIRIEAPVPGKGYIGIEVPNTEVSLVALRDVMESEAFQRLNSRLRLGLGKDVSGNPVAADLRAMPHLLIAGTTGSGKSVCVNAIVACLLLQNTPDDLKLVMVDPKRVELTYYNGIPHLLAPVVVELERVVSALQWVSREMDRRYQLFAQHGVRNLRDYNQRMQDTGQRTMPNVVVVIDELADLMMIAPDETERVITRLAQLARATGIHLIIATQRPSVDVVTGLIKANFPARIAFAVASSVDSRVILDQPGAERLLGRGDMLFQSPDAASPIRMQGAFVSESELMRLIRFWKNAALGGEATQPSEAAAMTALPSGVPLKQVPLWEEGEDETQRDPLYEQAVDIVRKMRRASISLLQRRLRIGYTRAARLVDQLEEGGIIGPAQSGSQPREVLDYGLDETETPAQD